MPEVSQYSFSHKELLELLIKKAGLHEGRWMLTLNFGFSAINAGPTPEQIVPGVAVGIQSIGILRAPPDAPEALTLDATIINPAVK